MGLTTKRPKRSTDLVTADEIACWAYCPEQWRLQYGLGQQSANREQLAAGTTHHSRLARAEVLASASIALGRILAIAALLTLAYLAASKR